MVERTLSARKLTEGRVGSNDIAEFRRFETVFRLFPEAAVGLLLRLDGLTDGIDYIAVRREYVSDASLT